MFTGYLFTEHISIESINYGLVVIYRRFIILRKRLNITLHNLFSKVLKTLDILQTECELIFKPFLKGSNIEYFDSRSGGQHEIYFY